jgi:hypothetical protein
MFEEGVKHLLESRKLDPSMFEQSGGTRILEEIGYKESPATKSVG